MEALPTAKPWEIDPQVVPLPWRTDLATPGAKRLKVGFVVDDGVVKVQPPIARAVRTVVDALKAAGHEGTHAKPLDRS
jgi:amidase